MSENVERVINRGRQLLIENPFDAGHDLDHHTAVVQNCINIVQNEGLIVDMNALLIAAYWHDYLRGNDEENDKALTLSMLQVGLPRPFISKVLAIKNSHSYGNGQETLEAQILFDADKLEYLSAARMKKVSNAVECGEMSLETQKKYKERFKERIRNVLDQIHFDYTRNEANKRIENLKSLTQNDPLWSGIVDGL